MNKLCGNRDYMKEINPINIKLALWARQLHKMGHKKWAHKLTDMVRKGKV